MYITLVTGTLKLCDFNTSSIVIMETVFTEVSEGLDLTKFNW